MKDKYFFECCRDLRTLGGLCCIDRCGEILVRLPLDIVMEEPTTFAHPLFVVSRMVTGFLPSTSKDIWTAAKRLELSQEFSLLVFTAAIVDIVVDPKVLAVREELLYNLRPVKTFDMPFNSIHAPVIPFVSREDMSDQQN